MDWLTENSFPAVMWGILAAFATGVFWFVSRKTILLIAVGLILLVTAAIVVIEINTITDREQLTSDLYGIAVAIQADRKDEVLSFVSPDAEDIIAQVNREMPEIDFKSVQLSAIDFKDVRSDATPATAIVEFNAKVVANAQRFGGEGKGVTHVTLDYRKEANDQWKILKMRYTQPTLNDFIK